MPDWDVLTPQTTAELAELLVHQPGKLLAGGTDLIPRLHRAPETDPVCLIDLSRLSELHFIRQRGNVVEIGALTTHAEIAASSLLQQVVPALVKASGSVGSPQTRTRGTLGGNLANASPAADTATPLLCLEAQVVLVSHDGQRQAALAEFFESPGRTCLQAGEYLHSISFPVPTGRWGADFQKLGRRNGMAIAVASGSVFLELDEDGVITVSRVALGSVAAKPVCSPHAEAVLEGQRPTSTLFEQAAQAVFSDISPIDDLRASREYRIHSAMVLVQRALEDAARQAESRSL